MLSQIVKDKIRSLIGFIKNESKIKEVEKSWEDYFNEFHIISEEEQEKEFIAIMKQRIDNFKFVERG